MRYLLFLCFTMLSFCCVAQHSADKSTSTKGYQVGDLATDFELKNVDGEMYSLSSFENAKGYIVVYTSNECPFAIAYEDRLIELHNEMAPMGYPVIAINSNDGSEGNGNTFKDMVTRHQTKSFPYVYLKDENKVYQAYGATKTPHVFLLDKERTVRYIGAIDDNSNYPADVEERYVANAIAALELGQSPNPASTKAIGCPITSKGRDKKGGRPGGGRKGPPSAEEILKMMDANNDEMVSKEEAHGPLARDFDRLDANGDNKLSKTELMKLKKRK